MIVFKFHSCTINSWNILSNFFKGNYLRNYIFFMRLSPSCLPSIGLIAFFWKLTPSINFIHYILFMNLWNYLSLCYGVRGTYTSYLFPPPHSPPHPSTFLQFHSSILVHRFPITPDVIYKGWSLAQVYMQAIVHWWIGLWNWWLNIIVFQGGR